MPTELLTSSHHGTCVWLKGQGKADTRDLQQLWAWRVLDFLLNALVRFAYYLDDA